MEPSGASTSLPPARWSCSSCGGGRTAAAFCRGPLLRAASSCGVSCAFEEAVNTRLTLITAKKIQSVIHHPPPRLFVEQTGLLVANRFHWIEPRSFDRRINAEYQPDRNGNHERQKNGADSHNGGPSGEPRDEPRHCKPKDDSQKTAGERDQDGFDDELPEDVPSSSANRAAHTDFTRSLENRRQHDVHDSDPADEQRNGRGGHHTSVDDLLGAFLLRQQLGCGAHVEVPPLLILLLHHAPHPFPF